MRGVRSFGEKHDALNLSATVPLLPQHGGDHRLRGAIAVSRPVGEAHPHEASDGVGASSTGGRQCNSQQSALRGPQRQSPRSQLSTRIVPELPFSDLPGSDPCARAHTSSAVMVNTSPAAGHREFALWKR